MTEPVASESVPTSVGRVGLASRTDGRTDGLTKNWETERTSGTFRNAHTRVQEFAPVEVEDDVTETLEQPDVRPEAVRLREQLDAAYGAIRDLGRQVRALRAKLTEAEERC